MRLVSFIRQKPLKFVASNALRTLAGKASRGFSDLAKGCFEITSWDESPVQNGSLGQITRATAMKEFKGDMCGTSTVEAVMCRLPNEVRAYSGVETFTGEINGLSGSVVFTHLGTENKEDRSLSVQILRGSGTGELSGVSGVGENYGS